LALQPFPEQQLTMRNFNFSVWANWAIIGLVFALSRAVLAAESDNPIFAKLLAKGGVPGAGEVALPKPTLADGQDLAAQKAAIATIADENHPFEALARKSIVAPLLLKISGDDDADSATTVRRVDVWFIAHGSMGEITDDAFWKHLKDSNGSDKESHDATSGHVTLLTADDLKARGITDPADQRHIAADVTLFNRVRITGTMQAMQTRTKDSVLVAALLDPRFDRDRQYRNGWQAITHDDTGAPHLGDPQLYRTAGWYAKATRLSEPPDAIFVEYHILFDEPAGWFNGANLLRSKLPLVVQEAARKFRRRLQEESAKH
jgi:hypothetical protein